MQYYTTSSAHIADCAFLEASVVDILFVISMLGVVFIRLI